jgi:hypothetical protein
MCWTLLRRISLANIGPNRFHPMQHRLAANVDATLEQQILDIPQGEGLSNVHHDDQPEQLRRGVELAIRVGRLGPPTAPYEGASGQSLLGRNCVY